jgi:hypothetical protein
MTMPGKTHGESVGGFGVGFEVCVGIVVGIVVNDAGMR